MPKIYEDHGCHARRTYEDCVEVAERLKESGWIMECPINGYNKGWHFIVGEFDYYCTVAGWIPRARVDIQVVINPMFTGVKV